MLNSKLFNLLAKFPVLRIFLRWYEYIVRPAPLDEFKDYDAYWESREKQGLVIRELDRFRTIARLIDDGSKVLDIGSGDCAFQHYIHKIKPDCLTLGLDTSPKAVSFANENGFNAQVLNLDIPLKQQLNSSWDVVTVMEVIEHIPDAEVLMREIIDLKPNKIFITIPNVGCLKHRTRLMLGGRFPITSIYYHMKEHVRFWTVKDFEQWAETFDLEITGIHGQFYYGDRFKEFLTRKYPALFAEGVIYELSMKSNKND